MTLAADVLARKRGAIARALDLTEDRRPSARAHLLELLDWLTEEGAWARSHVVGVTGPPGVGKSTLVGRMIRLLRARGVTLGVLAVDPSSLESGGALLGDRLRIAPDPGDDGLFVRSLATQGETGGLARSVPLGAFVLGSVFDEVVIETVGVGQTETEIRHVADTVVLAVQPGSGDVLQFLKAGIMEVPDVIVVNKSDEGDMAMARSARRAEADLQNALSAIASVRASNQSPPVVRASARDGTGLEAVIEAIGAHRERLRTSGSLDPRRREGRVAWGLSTYVRRHGEAGLERRGGREALRTAFWAASERPAEVLRLAEGDPTSPESTRGDP